MEKKIRKVVRSEQLVVDLADIFQYGIETFGITAAKIFLEEVTHRIQGLSFQFYLHPECRHIPTQSKMYRNIVLENILLFIALPKKRLKF